MRKIIQNQYFIVGCLWLAFTCLQAQNIDVEQNAVVSKKEWLSKVDFSKKISKKPAFRWPWTVKRMNYFSWWGKKVGLRIVEGFQFGPSVRYFNQKTKLQYIAEETVFGGEISVDEDLLNTVNFPSLIENRLGQIRIELPTGLLSRTTEGWTSMSQLKVAAAGISLTGSYWAGALAPRQFPQPKDIKVLFNPDELIDIAARQLFVNSALNNAVSMEVSVHPIQFLTGFRKLEWLSEGGFYLGGDFSIGWVQSTDLTFKQGRELLGDIDLGQEIREVLPNSLENLIDTDEAGDLLLTALEGRIPLYGFGIPKPNGRTFQIESWLGYLWMNSTWSGDVRLGLVYQSQELSNDHPSKPVFQIRRWAPTILVKWVFNKEKTESSLFGT